MATVGESHFENGTAWNSSGLSCQYDRITLFIVYEYNFFSIEIGLVRSVCIDFLLVALSPQMYT